MLTERQATAATPETFLSVVHNRINLARQNVSSLVDRCATAGFYGPPENAGKAEPPADNTTRTNIIEELERLQHNIDILTHQLERLA